MDRLKLMMTFESVARLGSYTPAAKELGVTRAMISKRIQELERVLNVKLLNRTTQRVGMTSAGTDYYKDCRAVLADIRAIEERLLTRRREVTGDLKILCSKTFGELVLAPILVQFCREHSGIRPHLVLRDLGRDEHDLISRGFDLAVRPQEIETTSLVAKPIVALPRVIVAAPSYLQIHGAPVSPVDLVRHACLSPNGQSTYDWTFLHAGQSTKVRVSGALKCTSSTVVRHAALEGLGIALIGEYVVRDDLAAGRLIKVLEGYELPKRMLHILYQRDRYQPLRTRLFMDYLSKRIKDLESLS